MNTTSEREELAKTTRSSALEVALGLGLAGAVCGFVALSQFASARAVSDEAPFAALGASPGLGTSSPVTASDESTAKAHDGNVSDSMEVALLLRQRSSANQLIDEAR